MSTMLRTTNPGAVDELEPYRDRRVPYIGQTLVFHCRPGEGRGGKPHNAAICTRIEDDDHVELLVIYAADDFLTRFKIPRKTDQNPVNAWSFNDWDDKFYMREQPPTLTSNDVHNIVDARLRPLHEKIASLEAEMRRLFKAK